jgi:hypothetical protein
MSVSVRSLALDARGTCRMTSKPGHKAGFLTDRTSTTVSRSADGFERPSAVLKWSCVTAMLSSTAASISSSSRSMTSIFSRMHCSAASVQSAARSAPT